MHNVDSPVLDADNHYDEVLDAFTRHLRPADGPHSEGLPEPTDWVTELQELDADSVAKIMGGNVSILNERQPAR